MTKKSISPTKVKHIANLAKLKLTDKELNKFSDQLSNVLDYMDKIAGLNISQKTAKHMDLTNRFREDVVDKSRMLTQKQALSQSKKTYKGYFVVKALFK